MANPAYPYGAFQRPAKGTALMDARQRRHDRTAAEAREKDRVRVRDRICRWPHCENCRRFTPRLEVAHLDAKGMGGDPRGAVTTADQMVLLDYLTHQSGIYSLEQHGRRIEPLTDRGTDGPCEFWQSDGRGGWYLVARERAPFVYEKD